MPREGVTNVIVMCTGVRGVGEVMKRPTDCMNRGVTIAALTPVIKSSPASRGGQERGLGLTRRARTDWRSSPRSNR